MNEKLKIENQLCFPLYACSKEIIRKYKSVLDKFNLTYTQYIVMMVMWEEKEINVKSLGERLYLDSGTLTPVLKKLESKSFIKRTRSDLDERNLKLLLTPKGIELMDKVQNVPSEIGNCINLSKEEYLQLYKLLYKILDSKV